MTELVLNEDLDDLRWVYEKDPTVLNYIDIIENEVLKIYREFILKVENIYAETKNMNRKEFAIYQKENNKQIFPILMDWYNRDDILNIYDNNRDRINDIFEKTKHLDKKEFSSYHRKNNKDIYSVLIHLYFNYEFDIIDFFLKDYIDYEKLEKKINNMLS